ncbi:hypothetical protein O181_063323 [Austropuccinia psidii MF-1]|uniref:Uncharacterized protein n=1 Tax=Austropuccinia psidii MF-1 TaxID=1389203 RepID=A0A9Q3EL67_9BASI|nr:hypothetical protein [Austropuccinia psidii MF-1]
MSSTHLRELRAPSQKPEDRTRLSRSQRERGLDTILTGKTLSKIIPTLQLRPPARGLDRHGSSSSSPSTTQRPFPMDHGKKDPT